MQQPNDLKYMLEERKIEKAFLFLVGLSVLLHLVAYKLVSLIPSETVKKAPVATIVDLTDLPIREPRAKDKRMPPTTKSKRKPERKPEPAKPKPEPAKPKPPPAPLRPLALPPAAGPNPVPTPLKPVTRPFGKPLPATPPPPKAASPSEAQTQKPESVARKEETGGLPLEKGGTARVARGEGLFRPRPQLGAKEGSKDGTRQANLFPSARNMQDLEKNYRKKYRDFEQGDTRMIDTEDPLIGGYAHRLLVKAQDSVQLEGHKAPPHHNGVGVLQVTILRDGTMEDVRIMEPSGNKDVDDFFIRSVYKTGYVGPLPKKWPHDKLNLVWVYSSHVLPGSP